MKYFFSRPAAVVPLAPAGPPGRPPSWPFYGLMVALLLLLGLAEATTPARPRPGADPGPRPGAARRAGLPTAVPR